MITAETLADPFNTDDFFVKLLNKEIMIIFSEI